MKLTVDAILSKEETRWSGAREVLLLAFPIVMTVGSNTLMNAADTWMVTRFGGKEYVASIMPAGLMNHVLVSFFIGVASCVSTFVSQSYGRRELRECSHYAWQGVHLSVLIAIVVMAVWPLTPAIFSTIGHSAEVQRLEVIYFKVRLWGVGGAVMSVALAAFFYSTGRPAVPMVATILSNLFNLAGDYVLIFGKLGFPAMGIRGAAIATNIAAWLCSGMMFAVFLTRAYNQAYSTRRTWQWDLPKVRRLFRIGWPSGLSMGMDVASWAVFTALIIGHFGDDALAAGGITGQILAGSFMPTVALGIAVTAVVGQWIGRKSLPRARARYKTALKLGVAYMTLMGVMFVVFRHHLIRFFLEDEPEVIALGGKFLIFAAAFQFFDATAIVTSGALKGAGDTRWPMVAHMVAAWCVFVPLGYGLAFHTSLGVFGGWVAATVYIWLLGIALFWRFFSGKWQTIDIFERARETSFIPVGPAPAAGNDPETAPVEQLPGAAQAFVPQEENAEIMPDKSDGVAHKEDLVKGERQSQQDAPEKE